RGAGGPCPERAAADGGVRFRDGTGGGGDRVPQRVRGPPAEHAGARDALQGRDRDRPRDSTPGQRTRDERASMMNCFESTLTPVLAAPTGTSPGTAIFWGLVAIAALIILILIA